MTGPAAVPLQGSPGVGEATLANGEVVGVVREMVPVAEGAPMIPIERPEDPPALLQDWCNRADPAIPIPYWAEIWPASRSLARLLWAGPDLGGSEVLDLGCGLGLAGVAAGLRGARVCFADYHPDALAFAARNAFAVGLRGATFLQVNWRLPEWARAFDLVLGADVIYERSEQQAIAELLERLLDGGGRAWLAEPTRVEAQLFLADWEQRTGIAPRTLDRARVEGLEVVMTIHELRMRWADRNT